MTPRTLAAVAAAVLVLLASCVGAGSPSVAAQTGESESTNGSPNPTVTVGASASVEATPDLAVVRVAVEATAESAEEARATVAADAERMRAALRDAGVPNGNVSTEAFNVYPQYDYSDESRELVGYRAVHAYRVEIAPDRAGEVIDVAIGNGATSVYGVSFELSEEVRQDLREQALTAAVENARADAETVATVSGASLGDVRSISTSDGGGGVPIPFAEDRGADGGSTVVEPGTVRVTASVTVVYDLA
ncbi:SIMPL domain-containing protein [Salinirubellus sp. GCM10025818]|uniref:SIMPL domain-containing protein n=1 Tax=Salinirubellus TaxID=2162630 RepID=UPI0030CC1AC6